MSTRGVPRASSHAQTARTLQVIQENNVVATGPGGGQASAPILEVCSLTKSYTGIKAVSNVSFEVTSGQILGILGSNGAGKSTLFKMIAGHVRQDSGSVRSAGICLDSLPPHARAGLGIGLVFQQPKLFEGMTVFENILAGLFLHGRGGFTTAMLRLPRHWQEERQARQIAMEAVERYALDRLADSVATTLPFGLQRKVAVARAAVGGSKLLLLDEPAAGLTGGERSELEDLVVGLPSLGVTVLAIEHDVRFISRLADSLLVLERGSVIAEGPSSTVLRDPKVIEAYSGTSRTC